MKMPAKKRTVRDPERTRNRLLDAAEREFNARGFEGKAFAAARLEFLHLSLSYKITVDRPTSIPLSFSCASAPEFFHARRPQGFYPLCI
jgi:hypothetical protein